MQNICYRTDEKDTAKLRGCITAKVQSKSAGTQSSGVVIQLDFLASHAENSFQQGKRDQRVF